MHLITISVVSLLICVVTGSCKQPTTSYRRHLNPRDASTLLSGGTNNEGESHTPIIPPEGSVFSSVPVGSGGEQIAVFWSRNSSNTTATQAFIMIHGKLRNGAQYWTTMNDALKNAVSTNVEGADANAIIVAPEFFSTKFNSGQYSSAMLGWGDVNGWQAGDPANHPNGTKLTSMDALDALVEVLSNVSEFPSLRNITIVGHGGGGQLCQRYAAVAKSQPLGSRIHVRYIHGDPSSCVYFTKHRPTIVGETLPSTSTCQYYNTWRYGFDNFTGTSDGLKTPHQYFAQYISRDVVSIVGYQDVQANGDNYCMAQMQGGSKRRDRNLIWWQYINILARTKEDLSGFPGTFTTLPDWSYISRHQIGLRLIVVENATHDANQVSTNSEGQAALFSSDSLPTGWRPSSWHTISSSKASSQMTSTASHQETLLLLRVFFWYEHDNSYVSTILIIVATFFAAHGGYLFAPHVLSLVVQYSNTTASR